MIVTLEYELDLDRIMDRVRDEIKEIIADEEGIDWNCLPDASRKDLYKKIAEYILKEWA